MCARELVKHMCVCVCVCGRGREGVEYLPICRECVYVNQCTCMYVCACGGGGGGSTSHSGVECFPKVAIHWRGSSIEKDGSTEEGAPSEWRRGGGGGGGGRRYPHTCTLLYNVYREVVATVKLG